MSKVLRPPINESRMTVKVALRDKGRDDVAEFDPGTPLERGGVKVFGTGIEVMPAIKMSTAMPTPRQTSMSPTEKIARSGLPNQLILGKPTASRATIDNCRQ